jgi:hypothetical protein
VTKEIQDEVEQLIALLRFEELLSNQDSSEPDIPDDQSRSTATELGEISPLNIGSPWITLEDDPSGESYFPGSDSDSMLGTNSDDEDD